MSALGKLGLSAMAALALTAGLAGCKDKESLVVVTISAAADEPTLTTARISVGTFSETFSLKAGVGVPYDGVSFGLYVPSGVSGLRPISVVASQPGNSGCATGSGQVNITTVGQTYGPVAIELGAVSATCPTGGSGGTTGTGGTGGRGTGGGSGGFTCFEYDHGNSGDCQMAYCTNDWGVYGAAFSPVNGGLAVTSGSDGRTKVWTVSNGSMVPEGHVLSGGTGVGAIAFSPDGTLLAVGQDGGVQIFSVPGWTLVRTLTVSNRVYGVGFSPDGSQLITLDTDENASPTVNHVYVHAVANPTPLASASLNNGWALGVSPVASASGLPVAVTTQSGTALIYMLTASGFSTPTTVNVTADGTTAETAQFSPDGNTLALGGDDGVLQFLPFPFTGASQPPDIDVSTVTGGFSEYVDVVAFSPNGSQLALGGGLWGSLTTYTTASRAQVGTEQDTSAHYDVFAVGYSPDGKYIIGGEADCGCVFLCH